MFNSPKAIIIVGAILIVVLIMSVSMYIYNSAASTIRDSMSNTTTNTTKNSKVEEDMDDTMIAFSNSQVEAFNNNFESYVGKETGSNIKALITRLIANAKTYDGDDEKIPSVYFENENKLVEYNQDLSTYVDDLTEIKNDIENTHTYYVTMTYHSSGYIDTILISYDSSNPVTKVPSDVERSQNENTSSNKLSREEISAYNEGYGSYIGRISGRNLEKLLNKVSTSYDTYKDVDIRGIPDVYFEDYEEIISIGSGSEAEKQAYIDKITELKGDIVNAGVYYVDFSYDDDGLIEVINIVTSNIDN